MRYINCGSLLTILSMTGGELTIYHSIVPPVTRYKLADQILWLHVKPTFQQQTWLLILLTINLKSVLLALAVQLNALYYSAISDWGETNHSAKNRIINRKEWRKMPDLMIPALSPVRAASSNMMFMDCICFSSVLLWQTCDRHHGSTHPPSTDQGCSQVVRPVFKI